MRTQRQVQAEVSVVYSCELENCIICGRPLEKCHYYSGRKTVQTMSQTMRIAYQAKRCPEASCQGHEEGLKSARWQQIAPLNGTYGYDVIGHIGWQRQTLHQTYMEIQRAVGRGVEISVSQVRYLYNYHYLPLLACQERGSWAELEQLSTEVGLILGLDGLAPEGGEPQLWLVRELRTGKTLRSGWLSEQGQTAFENFLGPIAEAKLRIEAVISDKQRGLVPAIGVVFPAAKHAYCQSHYLSNMAEPLAKADEGLKVSLRKQVRQEIGDLIRPEQVEQAGVLTVTGMLPTPLKEEEREVEVERSVAETGSAAEIAETEAVGAQQEERPDCPECSQTEIDRVASEQTEIESAFKRRIRYLLTLKGRLPFRLAGIEMYERLQEVSDNLVEMLMHRPSACLQQLHSGVELSLAMFKADYLIINQGAEWLHQISELLDPQDKPARTGEQVQIALLSYLDDIGSQAQENQLLVELATQIQKSTRSYQSGLFHTYDIPDLPRTNNDRETEFRGLNQHLLRTTGQKGGTRRLIQRSGAWELIPRPDSLTETISAISTVEQSEYEKERTRVRIHRDRLRFHTRSVKHSRKQLQDLKERWLRLPPGQSPETAHDQAERDHL